MKLMVKLPSMTYALDYHDIGVEGIVVSNDAIASRLTSSFSLEEIQALCCDFDVYILMNLLYREDQLPTLRTWLHDLHNLPIKGIIFQDFAVLSLVKKMNWEIELIYHPETLATNHLTLNDLSVFGVTKAFLSREISLEEINQICRQLTIESIVQVHGVIYLGQSGRKLLTNYFNYHDYPYNDQLRVLCKDSDIETMVSEDQHGTNMMTTSELCALEILNQIESEWVYIETLGMEEVRALELTSLYHDAVLSINEGTFTKDIHAYRPILGQLMKHQPQTMGFFHDSTVYKLEDVREKDNEKRNQ